MIISDHPLQPDHLQSLQIPHGPLKITDGISLQGRLLFLFQTLEASLQSSSSTRSSLIITDQLRSGVAHLRSSQLINGLFPSWSTGYSLIYEDFSRIYCSSEVGFLPFFVKVPSFPLVLILVDQTSGSGFDLTETKTSSCRKLLFLHPHPLICVKITTWGLPVNFFTLTTGTIFPFHQLLLLLSSFSAATCFLLLIAPLSGFLLLLWAICC